MTHRKQLKIYGLIIWNLAHKVYGIFQNSYTCHVNYTVQDFFQNITANKYVSIYIYTECVFEAQNIQSLIFVSKCMDFKDTIEFEIHPYPSEILFWNSPKPVFRIYPNVDLKLTLTSKVTSSLQSPSLQP